MSQSELKSDWYLLRGDNSQLETRNFHQQLKNINHDSPTIAQACFHDKGILDLSFATFCMQYLD